MENLTTIKNLATQEILDITSLALKFEKGQVQSSCIGKNIALLFFENSTRTRFSFEAAAHNLNLRIFNFDTSNTSLSKGESIYDTIENLYAIGISLCVIRSTENIIDDLILKGAKMRFINAGDGALSHPTQALLDFYTIKKYFDDINNKKVVITGDILHSRVAKSNIELLLRFGADITLVAPKYFQDSSLKNVKWSEDLSKNLQDADIVMGLRVQKERIESEIPLKDYTENFQINEKNINKKSILLHPGPVNRDIEISSVLLDSEQGKTILEQAKNGVYVRTALLEMILRGVDG